MKKTVDGHAYEYIDAVGEDGEWIHSPDCPCQKERDRVRQDWKAIDRRKP